MSTKRGWLKYVIGFSLLLIPLSCLKRKSVEDQNIASFETTPTAVPPAKRETTGTLPEPTTTTPVAKLPKTSQHKQEISFAVHTKASLLKDPEPVPGTDLTSTFQKFPPLGKATLISEEYLRGDPYRVRPNDGSIYLVTITTNTRTIMAGLGVVPPQDDAAPIFRRLTFRKHYTQ